MATDSTARVDEDWLRSLRREFHRHPEPAWREFWTTARVVEELDSMGVDDVLVGPEVLADGERSALPDAEELAVWHEQAREAGADPDLLERMDGGYTGALATVERGEGPTVALRVDIDGLPRAESESEDHHPAQAGFRSVNEGAMHACGHDAHATIGLGVLRAVLDSDFRGTFKLLFQPSEEMIAGGKPVAESGLLDDVDTLLAVHVGLDHPTGEVVAGVDGFLAVTHLDAEFEGEPAHAGGQPNKGDNAVQAMATAVQNLYAVARHEDGATRVNAGHVGGGSATNIIPEAAFIEGEVRGETTELMEYMRERSQAVIESAAEMHNCSVEVSFDGEAPSATSDQSVVDRVQAVAERSDRVTSVLERDELGGSEDATYLMHRVQNNGGEAAYVCVGTDHPGGHHTATFDVDEDSLAIGVEVLAESVLEVAAER